MWLTNLKIAIAEKDSAKLEKLLEESPTFSSVEQMQEALYLLKSAALLVYGLRDETALAMQQLKKNIDYMNATGASSKGKLDITF